MFRQLLLPKLFHDSLDLILLYLLDYYYLFHLLHHLYYLKIFNKAILLALDKYVISLVDISPMLNNLFYFVFYFINTVFSFTDISITYLIIFLFNFVLVYLFTTIILLFFVSNISFSSSVISSLLFKCK